jgi:two-component system CheB/CheR fusion protein
MAEFPIVGIGSSAGGLEALQKLFGAMPPDSGVAFIVAAHLDPTQVSHLTELLGRCTKMPVVQIERSIQVYPDHVYVIAPDQELTIRDGVVHTNKPTAPRGHRHPVDSFFRSLAQDQGERAIAIVLSGTGTNGSLGLRFIKAEGGVVLAQEPESAAFQGMPRSAIGTGIVDLVLPPEKMPDALLSIARHSYVREPAKAVEEATPEEQVRTLLTLVRVQTNRDYSSYKKSTLLRRIHRRMGLHRIDSLPNYIERLRSDPDEIKALSADLTINVTGFFRDPEAWRTLTEKVIAPLVRERPAESPIRVWLPGCSTGEEAYSIAILFTEQAEAAEKNFELTLFASDVAEGVLSSARAGQYPGSIALDVGEKRLERFFDRQDDTYYVRKTLREAITFAPQNLLEEPPFSRLDLISCRNLLIYLEPAAQKHVLGLFHFALREGGYLFLGPAESVAGQEDLFQPISKKWRIYRRVGPTRHDLVDFPPVRSREPRFADAGPASPEPRTPSRDVLDQAIIEHRAPASVLIDAQFRVHYSRGPTDDYLGHARGEPTHHLLAIARSGLRTPLRVSIRKALDEDREVTSYARVRRDNALHPVRLVVTPLKAARDGSSRLIVSFFGRDVAADAAATAELEVPTEGRLQTELDTAREDLRIAVEQMEAGNEELKASNEEVRSVNEELQASNEELETSREELQSLNEELNTLNNQLQAKVGELEARTDELNNLLNSTDVATLFLDRSLCIRWFTPSMKALLELLPTDLGRPISHFAQRFSGGNLLEDARKVLERLQPSDAEVVDDLGRWYIRHIVPYRTAHDRIEGVAVTFIEITERKRWEEELQLLARELSHRVKNTLAVVQSLAMQTDGGVQSVEAFRGAFVGRLQALARAHGILLDTNWRSADLKTLVEQTLAAYRIDHPEVAEIEGEPVALTPQQGLGLSLMLHELGTNAAKYGALSQREGRLRVSWQVEERSDRHLRLKWEERGGPRVTPPTDRGFGLQLIERAVSYELEGALELDFARDGFVCEVVFPLP